LHGGEWPPRMVRASARRAELRAVDGEAAQWQHNLSQKWASFFILRVIAWLQHLPDSPIYFFLFRRASTLSKPALINRMTQRSATATRRIWPTEHGIAPPLDGRVACGLLQCHYRRSTSQLMRIVSANADFIATSELPRPNAIAWLSQKFPISVRCEILGPVDQTSDLISAFP